MEKLKVILSKPLLPIQEHLTFSNDQFNFINRYKVPIIRNSKNFKSSNNSFDRSDSRDKLEYNSLIEKIEDSNDLRAGNQCYLSLLSLDSKQKVFSLSVSF